MIRAILSLMAMGMICGSRVQAAVAEEMKCEGAIIKVEGENVTVRDGTNERLLKVAPATKITSGGKPVSSDDLKVGQKVKCVCERREGKMVCTTMEIMRDTP